MLVSAAGVMTRGGGGGEGCNRRREEASWTGGGEGDPPGTSRTFLAALDLSAIRPATRGDRRQAQGRRSRAGQASPTYTCGFAALTSCRHHRLEKRSKPGTWRQLLRPARCLLERYMSVFSNFTPRSSAGPGCCQRPAQALLLRVPEMSEMKPPGLQAWTRINVRRVLHTSWLTSCEPDKSKYQLTP
jgi:hypothetical protein